MKSSLRPIVAFVAFVASVQCFAANDQPALRTIYLIRHGAYLPDPKADPQAGPGLSTLGIAQARLIGTRLRSMPVAFDSIVVSTMTRARQTASIIHEQIADVPLTPSPLIRECTPPARVASGERAEATAACQRQLDQAFEKYFVRAEGRDRNDVLVCHGNVIRYLTTKALGVDTKAWPSFGVKHTSLTMIEVHADGQMRVVAVGDTGHVPPTLQSWGDDADPNLVAP